MTKPQVLFIGDLNESLPEFLLFKESYEVIHYKLTTLDTLKEKLSNEFSQIVGLYGGWLGFVPVGGLTADLVQHLPPSLKVIAITSVGYDSYNVDALKERGIQLFNTPSLGASAVADTVLWHILESFRFYKRFEAKLRESGHTYTARESLQTKGFDQLNGGLGEGKDDWLQNAFAFGEIAGGQEVRSPIGAKCGIVGLGRIGQEVAKRASAIGMEIVYHQRNENQSLVGVYQYCQTIEELLQVSDAVVVCCPGNEHTRDLISAKRLDLMKHDSKLINVGRGFVIDEDYAIKKLQEGTLGWLGLDVYTGEPVVDQRLLSRWDVSLTPHMASSTKDNFDATAKYALANIFSVLSGKLDGQSRVC